MELVQNLQVKQSYSFDLQPELSFCSRSKNWFVNKENYNKTSKKGGIL